MGKNVIISTLPNISQNYLPKVNTSNIFANSLVYDDGSSVLINTTTASAFKLDVNGTARTGALTLTGSLIGTSATFSSSVNIGINTTSPSYKLHVNGTFYAAGSSIKYKESICQYDTNSCLFMCLKPVTYQYKDEFKHLGKELKSETQIGLIAEDVADVMPELAVLVNEEDEKVVRNVDYEKLSIVLLTEVQKLRREMDDLKHKEQ